MTFRHEVTNILEINGVHLKISGSTIDVQQRTPPTLTLKMVSPQQAEIVRSPRGLSTSYSLGECSKMPSTTVSPAMSLVPAVEHALMDFLSRPTKTWTVSSFSYEW